VEVGAAVAVGRFGFGGVFGAATLEVAHGQVSVFRGEVGFGVGKKFLGETCDRAYDRLS